jgi:hypothetical protein
MDRLFCSRSVWFCIACATSGCLVGCLHSPTCEDYLTCPLEDAAALKHASEAGAHVQASVDAQSGVKPSPSSSRFDASARDVGELSEGDARDDATQAAESHLGTGIGDASAMGAGVETSKGSEDNSGPEGRPSADSATPTQPPDASGPGPVKSTPADDSAAVLPDERDSGASDLEGTEPVSVDASADDSLSTSVGEQRDSGAISCTPFVDDGACPDGSRCLPKELEEGSECVSEGAGVYLSRCDTNEDCGPDLICRGTCRPACGPDALTGDPGSCPSGQVCQHGNQPTNLGYCADSCEWGQYDCGPSRYCSIAELEYSETDICVGGSEELEWGLVGQQCAGPGAAGSYCGGKHMCLDTTDSGIRCFELCRASVAPLGETEVPNHPDCLDTSASSCVSVFGADSSVGVCLAPG